MLVIPAIDLRGGKCVRLRQGDYAQETVFGDDPFAIARRWAEHAVLVHVVDLDGARAGNIVNLPAIRAVVAAAEEVGACCQLGGGIRSEADIEAALDVGVQRLVIGTKALKEPGWFAEMVAKYGNILWLGLDARDGWVATEGWLETSKCRALDVARRSEQTALGGIIYTDISRDGMLTGPNVAALEELAASIRLPIIASGGIATLDDLRRVSQLPVEGCIVGRALYEGKFTLREAISAAE